MIKFTNYFFILITLVVFPACSSVADTPIKATGKDNFLIGFYVYGHEVNSFQPCGNEEFFWVEGSNHVLIKLEEDYLKLVSEPYEKVFVKIVGKFAPKASDGFAADYDGLVQIEKLIFMLSKSKAECK